MINKLQLKNWHLRLLFTFICLLLCPLINAQNLRYKHYTTDDGLPHNIGYQILQDKKGYLWFGTDDGLVRFDGSSFKTYSSDHGLSSNYVISIDESEDSTLIIGTWGGGLNFFKKGRIYQQHTNIKNLKINNFKITREKGIGMRFNNLAFFYFDKDSLAITKWKSLYKRKNGTLYFSDIKELYQESPAISDIDFELSNNEELLFYGEFPGVKVYINDSTFKDKFPLLTTNDTIHGVFQDQKNDYWLGGEGKIYFQGKATNKIYTSGLPPEKIYYINCLSEEKIYFLTGSGRYKDRKLFKYNGLTGDLINITELLGIQADPSQLLIDRENNLWVTTNGDGIYCIYNSSIQQFSIKDGHTTAFISAFEEDANGNIWIGTRNGLFYYNGKEIKKTEFSVNLESRYTNHVFIKDLLIDENKVLLFSTLSSVYKFDDKLNGSQLIVNGSEIFQDNKGKVRGLSLNGKIFYSKDSLSNLFYNEKVKHKNKISYKVNGQYLLAKINNSKQEELHYFDADHSLYRVDEHYNSELIINSLPVKKINDLLYDRLSESYWIGTEKGLFHFSKKELKHFKVKDGLISNKCRKLLMDCNGMLWVGTPRGLCLFDGNTFTSYNAQTGLIANDVNTLFLDSNKNLWIGSSKGISIIDIEKVSKKENAPPLYIEKTLLNNEVICIDEVNNFEHNAQLRFTFKAIAFTNTKKLEYRYRLNNNEWVSTVGNYADFYALKQGNYQFEIQAKKFNSNWGKSIKKNFEILAPWWQTWWALTTYFTFGLGLIICFYNYELKRIKVKNELKLEKIESEKLKEVNNIKSRFFSNISHEFRTPLTLILGPIENLLARIDDLENRRTLKVVEKNAGNLLSMINQLLDLAKIESGKLKLYKEKKDIIFEVKSLIKPFEILAEKKNINFISSFDVAKQMMFFDSKKLAIIINNLLSNAFKFTSQDGEILLLAYISSGTEEISTFNIQVQDNGIGIPEKDIENVFNRFFQSECGDSNLNTGTGIGLALTKELVELHDGEISVKSKEKFGSVFTVSFPINKMEYKKVLNQTNHEKDLTSNLIISERESLEKSVDSVENKPILLIAEDNEDLRTYINKVLENEFCVHLVENGILALKKAKEIIPDLVVSDVMMPEMDGIELCKNLKENETTSHIPVILLTAKAATESKLAGYSKGADDYITKPFNSIELKSRIKNLLEQREKLRILYSKSIEVPLKFNTVDDQFIKKAEGVIQNNMENLAFDIPFFASEMSLSRTQLFRKLKAITNQTPTEFNRSIRLKRAAQLLNQKTGNVSEIAYEVGFNDPFYFSKCFTKMYGQPPSEYIPK